jgi:hypothetical protein
MTTIPHRASIFGPLAAAALLPLLASACPGDDALVNDSGSNDGTSTGTGLISTSGATVAETGAADGTSTGDTGSTGAPSTTADDGSSSDTGPMACKSEPTDTLPAVLEVSVEILNDTAATVYVLGTADGCTEYEVIRDGLSLPLQLGFACGCECPPPPLPTIEAVALDPGQSYAVTWDGRLLALYQERFLCDQECTIAANGSPQPLEPTPVTMTIPIYTEAGMYAQPAEGAVQTRCESPLSFSVGFELGTTDVTIPVALSEIVIR